MNIIARAFDMVAAIKTFTSGARRFYYTVMLLGRRCPKCEGSLIMAAEGTCECQVCRYRFDPTVAFQRCAHCGGIPELRVRRYQCKSCGLSIKSVFLFEGLVFDARYFKQKMAESRQRKRELRQRVRQMLAECRSAALTPNACDLDVVPGLSEALDSLTGGLQESVVLEHRGRFDLDRYQAHVASCVREGPSSLRDMPPLIEDRRLDLVWRFIAAVFLEQDGSIYVHQQGEVIWVVRNDDREGQDLFGKIEEADGFKGPVGGTQVW